MKFLLLNHHHGLVPFGWRLQREGHEVELLAWNKRYRRAWAGRFKVVQPLRENLEPLVEGVRHGAITAISDSYRDFDRFRGGTFFGTLRPEAEPTGTFRVGAWFDGERIRFPHLIVVDMGAWPGGLGPWVSGGLSVCSRGWDPGHALFQPLLALVDELKSQEFRGPVQRDITVQGGAVVGGAWRAGWDPLHAHALLAEVEGLGEWLMEPQDPFPKPFTVVLPVTVPPWPGRPAESPEPQPLEGLTGAQMSRFGLHDIQLDEESQRVYAAGLDGFVGVARGTGHTFELARGLALEVALAAQLREKQLRPDVGQHMGGALAALEAAGLLL